jgi:hypothetical protein
MGQVAAYATVYAVGRLCNQAACLWRCHILFCEAATIINGFGSVVECLAVKVKGWLFISSKL